MNKTFIGIDPGPEESAYVVIEPGPVPAEIVILDKGEIENYALLDLLDTWQEDIYNDKADYQLAIEMIASYGMPVGKETFETCVWIGRFIQAFDLEKRVHLVYRKEVKLHLCHDSRAKDANIHQALVDRYGKPGTKKNPGITYGITKDIWSALAVAVTYMENEMKII